MLLTWQITNILETGKLFCIISVINHSSLSFIVKDVAINKRNFRRLYLPHPMAIAILFYEKRYRSWRCYRASKTLNLLTISLGVTDSPST